MPEDEQHRLMSAAVDALTACIEGAEAGGNRARSRLLRAARERVVDAAMGRPRRFWEVWKR